jgi:hypothetical protein
MLFAIRAGRLQTPLAPFDPARRFAYRLRGWSRRLW